MGRIRWLGPLVIGMMAYDASADGTREGQESQMTAEERILFDFGGAAEPWPNTDDPVMGGRSRSRMRIADGIAVFEGVVSLENNGGFASLRSRPATHDLQGADGIVLRIRGDGKIYGVRLRTDSSVALEAREGNTADSVSYQAKLTTKADRWIEVKLPFTAFKPGFRGRLVRGYPALDSGEIGGVGLIISDKQEGRFRLEIDWIKAYRDPR